jgi:hypothetical protein
MKTGSNGTGRRTLLQRGLAFLTGAVAVGAGAEWAHRDTSSVPAPRASSLTLYGRKRPVASRATDARLTTFGELLDSPDGKPVGQFYSNCFGIDTPLGLQPMDVSSMEFQVLQLKDGALFGMRGGGTAADGGRPCALIGGTARYAGASGSYLERPLGPESQGHEMVEFVVTFAS